MFELVLHIILYVLFCITEMIKPPFLYLVLFNIQPYMLCYYLICIQFAKKSIIIINSVVMCILDISDILKKAPDKHKLLNLVADISDHWYEIGVCLKVPDKDLESIEKRPINDINKLSAVINIWEDTVSSPFTWETVITAMEGSIVNNLRKGHEIRDYLSEGNNYFILNL